MLSQPNLLHKHAEGLSVNLQRCIAGLFIFLAVPLSAQTVVNSGVPGENSADVLKRTPSVLLANMPAVAVVFVGMNDAANDKKFLSAEQTSANVLEMVKDIEAAGAVPVLVTVHYPDEVQLMARHDVKVYGDKLPAARVDTVNRALETIAREQHVALAGFHDALRLAGGANAVLSTDGVHMTAAGYALLAKTVFAALPGSARNGTVVCLGDSLTYGIGVRENGASEGQETYPAQLRNLLQPEAAQR